MLQIDHVYEFLYQEIFHDFEFYSLNGGVVETNNVTPNHINVFKPSEPAQKKIFFYDQEPVVRQITKKYIEIFKYPSGIDLETLYQRHKDIVTYEEHLLNLAEPNRVYKDPHVFVTSEKSNDVKYINSSNNMKSLYYFFHGFAALDWYRGYYALNYSKSIDQHRNKDYVSHNRIIIEDRSYRIYWVSKLVELGLLDHGQVSFNVADNLFDCWQDEVHDPNTKLSKHAQHHAKTFLADIDKLIIDRHNLPGQASANISSSVNALWNVVSETVFYYNKLHLTEKIFKPIVSKQPFMLLASPGNLEYLRSYGFKTFDGIIDESYDRIASSDRRIEAVADQLQWYCNLSLEEKNRVIERLAPIVEYNFHHFYGEFRHVIARELLDNCKALFKEIGYDDSNIAYENIYRVLTN